MATAFMLPTIKAVLDSIQRARDKLTATLSQARRLQA